MSRKTDKVCTMLTENQCCWREEIKFKNRLFSKLIDSNRFSKRIERNRFESRIEQHCRAHLLSDRAATSTGLYRTLLIAAWHAQRASGHREHACSLFQLVCWRRAAAIKCTVDETDVGHFSLDVFPPRTLPPSWLPPYAYSGKESRRAGTPRARIPSNFTQFAGVKSCCYTHFASKNVLVSAVFRPQKTPKFSAPPDLPPLAPWNDASERIPTAKILATPMATTIHQRKQRVDPIHNPTTGASLTEPPPERHFKPSPIFWRPFLVVALRATSSVCGPLYRALSQCNFCNPSFTPNVRPFTTI